MPWERRGRRRGLHLPALRDAEGETAARPGRPDPGLLTRAVSHRQMAHPSSSSGAVAPGSAVHRRQPGRARTSMLLVLGSYMLPPPWSVGVMRRHYSRRSHPGQGAPGVCWPRGDPVGALPRARGLAAGDAVGRRGETPLLRTRPADPTSTDAATTLGAGAGSLRTPLSQVRSGAMSSSVRPAVSGKHRATRSAPGNARRARAPIATQWDATTP